MTENPQKYQGHCFKSALMWHEAKAPLLPLALCSEVITRFQDSENEPAQEISPIGLRKLVTHPMLMEMRRGGNHRPARAGPSVNDRVI